jgi:hypothetical protein
MYKTIQGGLRDRLGETVGFKDAIKASAWASTLHVSRFRPIHDGIGYSLVLLVATTASAPSHRERHDTYFFFVVGNLYTFDDVRRFIMSHPIFVVAHVEVGQNLLKRPFWEQLFAELGLFFLMLVVALVAERENVL